MDLVVRLADPADVLPACRVRVASWRAAYAGLVPQAVLDELDPLADEARWESWRAQHPDRLLVAVAGVDVVGFAWTGPERDEAAPAGTGEVTAFYVHPDRWRDGIGTALMDATRDHLAASAYERVWLWVLEGNARARTFYERCGFAPTGDRKVDHLGLVDVRYARPLP